MADLGTKFEPKKKLKKKPTPNYLKMNMTTIAKMRDKSPNN